MPTNILLDNIRTRSGLKWSVLAMLLDGFYVSTAAYCGTLIDYGWSEWLHIAFLLLLWNAQKFILIEPIARLILTRAWLYESRTSRQAKGSKGRDSVLSSQHQ